MGDEVIDTSYEPFSQEPEYLELNKSFIGSLMPYLDRPERVLDLACGTGTLAMLLLDEIQPSRAQAGDTGALNWTVTVLGVDISRESLNLAQEHFNVHGSCAVTAVVEASADAPPVGSSTMDMALMGNAIHCFEDKGALLHQVFRVLRPGGLFAFNSSFYAGTIVPGTEDFYHRWMRASLEYVRRKDEQSKRQGRAGIPRVRGRGKPAFSSRWLAPAEYAGLLETYGFEVQSMGERIYTMSQRNFESVGAYAGLASVLLSGYPVGLACEALERSVGPAFAAAGVEGIARSSLEMIATKRRSASSTYPS